MRHYNFYALTQGALVVVGGGYYNSGDEAIKAAQNSGLAVDVVDREDLSGQKYIVWTANSGKINPFKS